MLIVYRYEDNFCNKQMYCHSYNNTKHFISNLYIFIYPASQIKLTTVTRFFINYIIAEVVNLNELYISTNISNFYYYYYFNQVYCPGFSNFQVGFSGAPFLEMI